MKTATRIEKAFRELPEGRVVGYREMGIKPQEYQAAAQALARLVRSDVIKRAGTGRFYRPRKTVFGELKPAEDELLRSYLFEDGRRIAYVTGLALYNRMGLTTQVPGTIQVASLSKRIMTTIGNLRIKGVKSYVEVTDDNFRLLELLDALKDFKMIPDLDIPGALNLLRSKTAELSSKEQKEILKIALKYPPRSRALIGAIIEMQQPKNISLKALKESINPLTAFSLGITPAMMTSVIHWNIN